MKTQYLYYRLRPMIPRSLQVWLRKRVALRRRSAVPGTWPIDYRCGRPPQHWQGWPDGKQFAFILTHDVDTQEGRDRAVQLADLERNLGMRALFNIVPERYPVSDTLMSDLKERGHEIGVHGLRHDGLLFSSRRIFEERAAAINRYLKQWGACGFRAPAVHHRFDWIGELDIEYDASSFDVDPFEPQPDGVHTIFPFWIPRGNGGRPYLEFPYTLAQDFTLFVLLGERSTDLWKEKLHWIAERGGMALLNTHPDYMRMPGDPEGPERYDVSRYTEFLSYVQEHFAGRFWHGTPGELVPVFRKQPDTIRTGIPKRIGMIAYTFYESDNRVMRYAEALANRGDAVEVLSLRKEGQPATEFVNGVQVYRLQSRIRNEPHRFSYAFRLLRFLFRSYRCTSKRVQSMPYDLLHIHNVPDFLVFAGWPAKRIGAKIILDIHDILPEFYASKFSAQEAGYTVRFLKALERSSIRFSDHVIISNHLWRKTLLRRGVPHDKCSAILNYPDMSIFFPPTQAVTGGPFVVIYPGTLAWHQGIDVALHAFSRARDDLPDTEFHIYGDGPKRTELEEMARTLRLESIVKFHGTLPLRELAVRVQQAHLGLVPKRRDSFGNEAFSTKILEFMAMRIPVVAADTDIDQFYFSEGQLRFFRSGDAADLARCLVELRTREAERKEMVEQGWAYVCRQNWELKRQEYLGLVDALVSGGPVHPVGTEAP